MSSVDGYMHPPIEGGNAFTHTEAPQIPLYYLKMRNITLADSQLLI